MSQIADRLARSRRTRAVGREAERALFRSALEADELPFCLLHVSGPGGVGKTTLLQSFRDLCAEAGAEAVSLDARNIDPSPPAFLAALRSALGLPVSEDPLAVLAHAPARRRVLLVDTYETLEMLDAWVREAFVPHLPGDTLVVLAGRTPLPAAWRADAGWRPLLRSIALRNLSPAEARAYLAESGIPVSEHRALLEFTHGHPLALSLVVDVFTQRRSDAPAPFPGGTSLDPDALPDVVGELLDRLVQEVPSPAHRTALEVCALARVTDEALLTEMLREDGEAGDGPELFRWLRNLSFVEKDSRGVFPHDVVREALLVDLRWRNRERYADLHRRARVYYTARLKAADGLSQQSLLYDCVFLHRDNAVVRAAFTWQEDQVYPDTLRPADVGDIARMVAAHEGEESARIARHWLERQPEATLVFRSSAARPGDTPLGFLTMLGLHLATDEDRDADPAARVAAAYLAAHHAPLRPGEEVAFMRFWMARDTYQGLSPVQSLIIVNALRQFLTGSRVAFTLFCCGDAAHWEPVFGYVEIPRLPGAEFTVGGRRYGVFGNDWRELPATAWLARLAAKETGGGAGAGAPVESATSSGAPAPPRPTASTLAVLSEAEFRAAVRDALRAYTVPSALRRNPLLRAPLVAGRARSDASAAARAESLRTLLLEAARSLASSPRLARGYRALHHTYFEPAATQEQAADRLDLPFSTYRRHLNEGIAELTRALWEQELGDTGG